MRRELKTGLLLFAAAAALNCIAGVPHFAVGFLMILAISLELAGALPEKTYTGLKKAKKVFFNKI